MFWAHSDPNGLSPTAEGARWQPLASHLREVAHIAERLAKNASPEDSAFHQMAKEAGLLHDTGKYAPSFQRLIRGELQRDPGGHAARGAALAWFPRKARDVAFAVVGHHTGIPNPNDGTGSLLTRVEEAREEANTLLQNAIGDCPEIAEVLKTLETSPPPRGRDLFTRFCCKRDLRGRLDTTA